jgi:hypothetical protein
VGRRQRLGPNVAWTDLRDDRHRSVPRNDPIQDHLVSRRFDFRIILVSLDIS